jgi:pyruvate kinase
MINNPVELLAALRELRTDVCRNGQVLAAQWCPQIRRRAFRVSATNLANYLALRQRDLRELQASLIPLGLSSLGRSEARVLDNLDAVLASLAAIIGDVRPDDPPRPRISAFYRGQRLLEFNAKVALGDRPPLRRTRIMVTLPTEAATDPAFVRTLIERGANWMRINCAHDDPQVWRDMIDNVRHAERATGKRCYVLMDLGGPKIRTGAVSVPDPGYRLRIGDQFLLTRGEPEPGGAFLAKVQCMVPEALDQLPIGTSVWIDDGKLGSAVETRSNEGLVLRVTHAKAKGEKLKAEKGLNFPDVELEIEALTDKDRADLEVAISHADAVGYSFVQSAQDVRALQAAIGTYEQTIQRKRSLTIVVKIETQRAIRNLPEIIVQAASEHPTGVLIARGDLAVEVGYQRMAELQEQILWMCEAAHVPVIWATQVLESFIKDGIPTRAEMTDAAMSGRAECVMLNKGAFVAQAVSVLDDVLTRMGAHQLKKTSQLRALRSWSRLLDPLPAD